ncbi:MAG: site-2 protease family protein [Acidobacteriaceae bacterium]
MDSVFPSASRATASPAHCAVCGAPLAPGARACPRCHALVHSQQLDALSAEAKKREASSDIAGARALWSEALALLPPDSTQAQWIRGHLAALPRPADENSKWLKRLGPLGPIALVIFKGKGLLFALFKLKFLFSLFAFVGVYWALYGWKFGIGFAASILIHEMGHYVDIKRRGLPAEMPVFLPGLGAYVKWQALGVSQAQRAQIALAGPLAGWLAAAVCAGLYLQTHSMLWAALARAGAALNVLNLIPIWVLDGAQAANALGRIARLALLCAAVGMWWMGGEGLFLLVAAGVLWRLFTLARPSAQDRPEEQGWDTLLYYIAVMAALALTLHVIPGHGIGSRW